jgi:FAD dependent oxidoreductase
MTPSRETSSLSSQRASLWLATTPETDFPALQGKVAVDVAIIGGGIAGLTAAVLLKESGTTVAVIEAGHVIQGVTGYTTAKVTSLHGLIYEPCRQAAHDYGVHRQGVLRQWLDSASYGGVPSILAFIEFQGAAFRTLERSHSFLRKPPIVEIGIYLDLGMGDPRFSGSLDRRSVNCLRIHPQRIKCDE